MVLEGLDGPFGSIGALQVGRGELEGESLFSHEGLESCVVFIVKRLKILSSESTAQRCVEGGVGLHNFMFAAGLQWFWNYGIAVIIVQDHDLLAAPT